MIRKSLVITISLLIAFYCVFSQHNVDSMILLLQDLKDKAKIDVLNQLAFDLKFNDQQASTEYAWQAKLHSKSLDYPEGEVKAILNIGIVHDIQGRADSSEWYFTFAYEFAKKNKLAYFEANAVNNLGMMNWNKGNFTDAIEFFYSALKLYEQQNNLKGISKATSNIGLIYQELNQWNKALEINLKAVSVISVGACERTQKSFFELLVRKSLYTFSKQNFRILVSLSMSTTNSSRIFPSIIQGIITLIARGMSPVLS